MGRKKNGKHPGPQFPHARVERAVEYRMLGYKWGEIETLVGVPHSTLMRWYASPDWKAMEVDWQAQDPLVLRAKAVLAKALMVELAKKVPDTALAERLLAPRNNGEDGGGGGGFGMHPTVVLLPMQNKGLESKPATQVLLQPAVEVPAEKPISTPLKSDKNPVKNPRPPKPGVRRRVAGPDE